MLYNFAPLADVFGPFNLFRYLTFRSIGAFLTALVLSFLIGGGLIRWLRSKQKQGQPIRDDGPASHLVTKKGTPTMGGLLILIALTVGTLLWADLTNRYVWIVLGITLAFGAVGFWDDFLKVTKRNPKGVPARTKVLLSVVVAAFGAYLISLSSPPQLRLMLALPFFKDVLVPLGMAGFISFAVLVIVGASNAVNLTDGLDGLAIGPVIMASAVFGLIAYVVGNIVFTNYLYVHHIPRSGELAVLLAALVGAGLGFLWFNAPPAMVFMGDTGAGDRRRAGRGRRRHQARDRAGHRGRPVRARDRVGHRAGPVLQMDRQAASSAWRRCIIISSRRAGPSRPSSSVSGSSPPSSRWSASPP